MRRKPNKLTRAALAAGVLSIVLSVCLCAGSTYAWFNHSLGSKNIITIGKFETVATAGLSEARSVTYLSAADTIFPAGSYDVSVRGVGNTPGYALIFLEAATSDFRKDVYYTPQLNGGTGYTYRIVLHEPTAIRVTPVWGRMEGEAPLEEDEIIWYGRPPVVEKPEEEQTQSADTTQTGDVTDSGTTTETPTTETPTTETPTTEVPSTEVPSTEVPSTETPSTETPSTEMPSTEVSSTETLTAGSTETAPATNGTQTSTTTGGTDGASAGTPSASSAEMAAPITGSTDSVPTAGGADSTPAAGGATGMPVVGGADSAPATGGADSAPTSGSDPE